MRTFTLTTYVRYYRRWISWFIKDVTRLGMSQMVGLLIAVAILFLQIHWGVISPNLSGHALESVLLPYIVVLGVFLFWASLRAPVALDRERAMDITALENNNKRLKMAIQKQSTIATHPNIQQRQRQIDRIKLELGGMSPREAEVILQVVDHIRIRRSVLEQDFGGNTTSNALRTAQRHGWVRVGPDQYSTERWCSIEPELADVLNVALSLATHH